MTPERWQQVTDLFEVASEREPGERAVLLAEACRGDEELLREVESLLAAYERAGSFIQQPALGPAASPLNRALQEFGAGLVSNRELVGQALGHYQILEQLGQGGMGVVYKARDQHLDRFVAVKVLPPELVADPDRKRRFAQEARAASALNHPNIVTIHDIASQDGTDFIVMEYVQGRTLGELMPRRGLKLNEVLSYAIQITGALSKAHAAGIIHRDLKPGNVMVSENSLVKVLDFGLAKLAPKTEPGQPEDSQTLPTTASLTEEGMILGSVCYMSPEQAEGKQLDARSDIFSFGALLYEMVTGQRAFQGDSKLSTLSAILHQDPRLAREVRPEVPRDLEKIIHRCLRKEPERRFQHMADVKVGLEELKEELASSSTRVRGAAGRWVRSKLAFIGVGILVAAIALGTAVWFWLDHANTGRPDSLLTPQPLTSYPGYEFSPSFSPDGSQVAFVWSKTADDESGADIYVKQIGVEEPYRLTDNPAPDDSPAWSPDGSLIAFARWSGSHIESGLSTQRVAYLVKPQRGGPERTIAEFDISPFASAASLCDWMPDSRSLIVVGRNAPTEPDALFMVSLETGERKRLTNPSPGLGDMRPVVSPDGRTLVFSRNTQEYRVDLYRLNLLESMSPQREPERLSFDNMWNYCAAWVPHQREIVFISGNENARYLCRMSPFTPAKIQRLAFAGDSAETPAVSRQGNRLAYSVLIRSWDIWRVEVGGKPKEPVKFISSTRDEMEPTYSPDGRRIAFASNRSGSREIWVCDSDGSHPVQLTSLSGNDTNRPRWSPDGQLITFNSDVKGNRDIYVIRMDGGMPKQLTTDPSTDGNPEWSADGKWIYFNSDRSGQQEIWKMPVGGGEAVRLQIRSGQAVESPDGKFLYYDKGEQDNYGIWRVPTNGGKETLVVDVLDPQGGHVVVDQGIYFISKPDKKGISSIRFKDFATGSIRTIVQITGRVSWGLAVSPDRHSFLYTQFEGGSDLMLVENFH